MWQEFITNHTVFDMFFLNTNRQMFTREDISDIKPKVNTS